MIASTAFELLPISGRRSRSAGMCRPPFVTRFEWWSVLSILYASSDNWRPVVCKLIEGFVSFSFMFMISIFSERLVFKVTFQTI